MNFYVCASNPNIDAPEVILQKSSSAYFYGPEDLISPRKNLDLKNPNRPIITLHVIDNPVVGKTIARINNIKPSIDEDPNCEHTDPYNLRRHKRSESGAKSSFLHRAKERLRKETVLVENKFIDDKSSEDTYPASLKSNIPTPEKFYTDKYKPISNNLSEEATE
jgi:hypothetical protein